MINKDYFDRDWDWHKTINKKCLAPWHSLTIDWTGNVYADAVATEPYGNLYENTLSEMWYLDKAVKLRDSWSNSKFDNPVCIKCLKKEQTSGSSRRQYFYSNFEPEQIQKATYKTNSDPDIWYLEINPSNKCNLKCRMCSGLISSTWIKDEIQLKEKFPSWMPDREIGKYEKLEFDIIKNLLDKKEHFKNLQFLKLTGGEPLMEEQNYQIMEQFIKWGIAKDVILDINTNGTIFNDRLYKIAKNFKMVKLHISIEGTGELYQYIRGGDNFTINQLEDNIKNFNMLANTMIIYTVTVQAYNIFDIANIWKWYLKIRKPTNEIYFKNVVVNPRYLSFHVLPNKIKQQAVKLLVNEQLPLDDWWQYDDNEKPQGSIGFKNIISGLKNDNYYSTEEKKKYLKEFVQFTLDLDNIRKTDIKQIVPQLKELFKRNYETV
jgi:MoaA/NifB/PqqE/SkfB family radical SAM enzyme